MSSNPSRSQVAELPSANCSCAPAADEDAEWECYCGLGPACPGFQMMSAIERAICTRDKRMAAEYYWKNGLWAI